MTKPVILHMPRQSLLLSAKPRNSLLLSAIIVLLTTKCYCEGDGGRKRLLSDDLKRLSLKKAMLEVDQESMKKAILDDDYDYDDLIGALRSSEGKKQSKSNNSDKKKKKRKSKKKKANQVNDSKMDADDDSNKVVSNEIAKVSEDDNKQLVLYNNNQEDNSDNDEDSDDNEDNEEDVNQEIIDRLEILRMEIETLKKQSSQQKPELPGLEELAPFDNNANNNSNNNNKDKIEVTPPLVVLSESVHQVENRKKWIPKAKAEETERIELEQQQRGWYLVMGVSLTALFIAVGVSYFVIRAYW